MPPAIRDQAIVAGSIAGTVALAWLYLIALDAGVPPGGDMPGMAAASGMALAAPHALGGLSDLLLAGTMWIVMMAGMMLPSATPMIVLYALGERRRGSAPLLRTSVFVLGYALVWTGFSLAALGTQDLLSRLGLLASEMKLTNGILGGALFVAAGLYEWSPLKKRCLAVCQSPFGFIAGHWRPGAIGALRMGLGHGTYCLLCCWALMLLLFAVGVMNLVWVAALGVLVLLQKLCPAPRAVARATGFAMVAVGGFLIAGIVF
ncbi:MAG: DUF2182 domain-containing protein [Stellaceae bacterium]